jgi:hypothetical protein
MEARLALSPTPLPSRPADTAPTRAPAADGAGVSTLELQTKVPNLGPYTMGNSGFYDLQLFPGPMLRMVTAPPTGQSLDVSA